MKRRPWTHQHGMAVMLGLWWLLTLMLLIQALTWAEVQDDVRDSLRSFQQVQAFEAARSGLDWGMAQADRSTSPCPLARDTLSALKSTGSAVPDTPWMSCSWPMASEPALPRCRCGSDDLSAGQPPGFALRYSRPAGSRWLLLQSSGCAGDCSGLQGAGSQHSVQAVWQPVWSAPDAWPVALLAGGRVSASGTAPVTVEAPSAWAILAGDDALDHPQSLPRILGGRWDSLHGQTSVSASPLPADLLHWFSPAIRPSAPDGTLQSRQLSALWTQARWPTGVTWTDPGAATPPVLVVQPGDWSPPAGSHLGSPQDPVLLRVNGTLRVDAPGVRITGLVLADTVEISAGLVLDGALWASGDVHLNGSDPIVLRHSLAAVQAAWQRAGRFAVRRGSWRDF